MPYKDPEKKKKHSKERYLKNNKEMLWKSKLNYWKNKDKILQQRKEYYKKIRYTPKYLYQECKRHAKQRNLIFELVYKDFKSLILSPCIYCGDLENYNGIDRQDNLKGYTIKNSVSCCKYCNWIKRDYSKERFLEHTEKIYIKNRR